MVELFAIPGFSEDSRAGLGPVARVAALRAPHAGQVERASRDSHPNCAMQVALWPEPPGWDLHPLRRSRPRQCDELTTQPRSVSVAPSTTRSDRTRRLGRKRRSILGITSASLRRAWRTTLAVPCSTGHIVAVGKAAPLARLVRPGLPGDASRLNGVTETC